MTAETDYAVAPAEYLEEWMEDTDCTTEELASKIVEAPMNTEHLSDLPAHRHHRVQICRHPRRFPQRVTGVISVITWKKK